MKIYPAIDLKDGQCVRLRQGDFNNKTVYNDNPVNQAKLYENSGASYIHLVDLDGAKDGYSKNIKIIKEIVNNIDIPIQLGGGIRTEKNIKEILDIGVSRVIIGTKAVEDIEFITRMIEKYQDKIVVSIDAKNDYVATDGWVAQSDIKAIDLCLTLKDVGLKTIVYTDISKDGMMQGIDTQFYLELKEKLGIEIIASGGITSLEDIECLTNMNIDGTIVGSALYMNKIKLKDALKFERMNENE